MTVRYFKKKLRANEAYYEALDNGYNARMYPIKTKGYKWAVSITRGPRKVYGKK